MGAGFQDKRRQVIPRWRTFEEARELPETQSPPKSKSPAEVLESADALFADKQLDWVSSPVAARASDLIATGLALGRIEEIHEAAKFVVSQGVLVPAGLREVAQRVLRHVNVGHSEAESGLADLPALRAQVRKLRAKSRDYERDPVLWVDLSRAHMLCGNRKAAERAMSVALTLGKDNRFVLRAAARMFVHLDDPQRAHSVLVRSRRTFSDPWLMAPEIAISAAMERSSRLIKHGRALVSDGRESPLDTSELAGAIGTLDAESGNKRAARKLFGSALEVPSENVVAQALWVARATDAISVAQDVIEKAPHSHEARAWNAFYSRDWKASLDEAGRWFAHEPYSSRAAVLASYVASSVFGRHRDAIAIITSASRAGRSDFMMLNNLAFAYASSEEVPLARKAFDRIDRREVDASSQVILTATEGLLEFRAGNLEAGRVLYLQALGMARAGGLKNQAALAAAYLAREEARAKTQRADAALVEAVLLAEEADCEEARLIVAGVQRRARERPPTER